MGVNGIYGLSGSGLDIESLVKVGMLNKQHQLDKMQQTETTNTWMKEEWATIYDKLQVYKYDDLSTYKMQSNMNAHKATSSDSSVVTATANGAAASMTHQVTVSMLATNAYLLTGNNESIQRTNTNAKNSNYLGDVIYSKSASTKIDGKKYYTVNGDGVLHHEDDIAISITIADSVNSDGSYNTKKLEYTYKDIFENEKTLYDLATDFGRTGATVQGNYDSVNNSFNLYNNNGGSSNVLALTANNDASATLLNNLRLSSYDGNTNTLSPVWEFKSEDTMATKMETSSIVNSSKVTSLKDVLGITANSVANGDGTYSVTISDKSNKTLATLQMDGSGAVTSGDGAAIALNLSADGGTSTTPVSFNYSDLFDLTATEGKMNSKATLGDLAAKINGAGTGTGIKAVYDVGEDKFSMTNENGGVQLTAVNSSTDDLGKQLVGALNLETAPATKLVTNKSGNLADVFGISAGTYWSNNKFNITFTDSTGAKTTLSSADRNDFITKANGGNGTFADQIAFSIDVGDGEHSSTVDITYGELFDFSKFTAYQTSMMYVGQNVKGYTSESVAKTVVASPKNLNNLADEINKKVSGIGIEAKYEGGTLSLLNESGNVQVTSTTTEGTNALNRLGLAKAANYTSVASKSITKASNSNTDNYLSSILGMSAVAKAGGGYSVTDSSGKTFDVAAADIGKAAFTLEVGDSDKTAKVELSYDDLFAGKADMSTLAAKINAAASAEGVKTTASYDNKSGKFTLNNDNGHATLTAAKDDSVAAKLVKNLGLKESSDTLAAKTKSVAGTDAKVTIDGKEYTLDKNSKTVAGVTYTFTEKSEVDASGKPKTANVTVTQDTDKIIDYVKKFVDSYNTLIDYMNDKLSEPRYTDFKPLTSTQEEQMTEKQIEKWTEKAKSGLLYHNNELRSIINNMREAIYTPVDAVESIYNSASAIGITSSNVKGHLKLDEDKLKEALAADPDCVYQIFASDQDSAYIAGTTKTNKLTNSQKKLDFNNTGLANRLYNIMTDSMNKVEDYAGTSKETDDQSYLGKLITNLQNKMSTFKTQMNAYETLLYKKYDSMEAALSRLGAQMNYVGNYGN